MTPAGQLQRRVDSTIPWIGDGREAASRVELKDARHVTIRPIFPSDLNALRTFFAALTHATRRLRFHTPINELSEHVLRKFTMVDHRAHVALIAEIDDAAVDQPTALIAEARYIRHTDPESDADPDSAEFALVVAEKWRRIGLGTLLTRILAQHARFAGVRRLCGDVLEDNKAMRGFAHSLGARLSRGIGSAQTVRLSLEV
jgi:acetyltransferase